MDDKGKTLHGRLEFFDRNVHQLTKHMTNAVEHHKDGVAQDMRFSARVKDVAAQEPFMDLQDRLVALAEITERIALERRIIMCERAQAQVLEKLAEIQAQVIGPTKLLLADRDSCIKALLKASVKADKQAQAAAALTAQAAGTPAQQAEQQWRNGGGGAADNVEVAELRQQLRNTEKVVDNNMELFEAQRVGDIKEILQEFIRCEMYYHCRALEVLAPALTHIAGVDGEAARENIREEIDGLNKKLKYT